MVAAPPHAPACRLRVFGTILCFRNEAVIPQQQQYGDLICVSFFSLFAVGMCTVRVVCMLQYRGGAGDTWILLGGDVCGRTETLRGAGRIRSLIHARPCVNLFSRQTSDKPAPYACLYYLWRFAVSPIGMGKEVVYCSINSDRSTCWKHVMWQIGSQF